MKPKYPQLLVADDNQAVRDGLKRLLEAERYRVRTAGNETEAIALFTSRPTDLVVLDVNLEQTSGWAVFDRMARLNPHVPTVIITAESQQQERAAAAGVEALLEKPIDIPSLLQIIRELLVETSTHGLNRRCGDPEYCRYVARHYEPFRQMMQERYSAPLHLTPQCASAGERPEFSDSDQTLELAKVTVAWPRALN